MSNAEFTKICEIRQYTEVVYYRNGQEIGRDTPQDDILYDRDPVELMTQDEIEAWT